MVIIRLNFPQECLLRENEHPNKNIKHRKESNNRACLGLLAGCGGEKANPGEYIGRVNKEDMKEKLLGENSMKVYEINVGINNKGKHVIKPQGIVLAGIESSSIDPFNEGDSVRVVLGESNGAMGKPYHETEYKDGKLIRKPTKINIFNDHLIIYEVLEYELLEKGANAQN